LTAAQIAEAARLANRAVDVGGAVLGGGGGGGSTAAGGSGAYTPIAKPSIFSATSPKFQLKPNDPIKIILREEVERKYLKPSPNSEKVIYGILNKLFSGADMYYDKVSNDRHDFEFCKNGIPGVTAYVCNGGFNKHR
jgi:hypothetical protein